MTSAGQGVERIGAKVEALDRSVSELWQAVEVGREERRELMIETAIAKKDRTELIDDLNGLGGRITRAEKDLAAQISGAADRVAAEIQRIEKGAVLEEGERKAQAAELRASVTEAVEASVIPLSRRLDKVEIAATDHAEQIHSILGSARIIIGLLSFGGAALAGLLIERALS